MKPIFTNCSKKRDIVKQIEECKFYKVFKNQFIYNFLRKAFDGVFSVINWIIWFKMKICDLCLDKWYFNQIQSLSTCQMHAVIHKFETLNLFNLCLIMWHKWALRISREMTEFDYFRQIALTVHVPKYIKRINSIIEFRFGIQTKGKLWGLIKKWILNVFLKSIDKITKEAIKTKINFYINNQLNCSTCDFFISDQSCA